MGCLQISKKLLDDEEILKEAEYKTVFNSQSRMRCAIHLRREYRVQKSKICDGDEIIILFPGKSPHYSEIR